MKINIRGKREGQYQREKENIAKNAIIPIVPFDSLPWAQEAKKKGLLQALQRVLEERESLAYELKAVCDVFICLFCLFSTCIRSMQILYFEDFLLVKMTCLCTDG